MSSTLNRCIAVVFAWLAIAASAEARYTLACESHEYRRNYCAAQTEGYARLINQKSSSACVQGRTWGYDRGGIWVTNGCSGVFEVGGGSRPGPPPQPPHGGGIPGWAVGSFSGTDATGARQTINIASNGAVTIRYGDRLSERGSFNRGRINMPGRSMGVQQIRNGIAVDGMAFVRR